MKNVGVHWDLQRKADMTKKLYNDKSNLILGQVKDAAKIQYANGYTNVITLDDANNWIHQHFLRAVMIEK